MMSWAEFIRLVWPIMATITPFILAGGFAWLKTQFPTKADIERLKTERETAVEALRKDVTRDLVELRGVASTNSDRLIAAEHRLRTVESELDRSPSKIELSKDIGKVAERVGRLESGIDTLSRQIGTHNEYLHTLIEKGLK